MITNKTVLSSGFAVVLVADRSFSENWQLEGEDW